MQAPEGDAYSLAVGWLKILLPLAALALLATLFLFSSRPAPVNGSLPQAELNAIAEASGLTDPELTGVADSGAELQVKAQSAQPGPDGSVSITGPRAVLSDPAGQVLVHAGSGRYDRAANQVTFDGLARIETTTGYVMESSGVTADLDAGSVETLGPLEARTPFGQLTAGKLLIEDRDGRTIRFTQGVRLLYTPETARGAP